MQTRQMKRQLAELGPSGGDQRLSKRSRNEPPAELQTATLASSEPSTKVRPTGADSASSARSARQANTMNTTNPPVSERDAPPSKRVRFQLDTRPSRALTDPIPAPAVDPPRTPIQMIDDNDVRALRGLLQGAAHGWSMADKAELLRHAAGNGNLDAFDALIEFGALQALSDEKPSAGRQSLLEHAAWGQNLAILDRLKECGLTIHSFTRDQQMMAIALSARKGGMAFLRRLCSAADCAGIRFQPADMRLIFVHTVQWEENERCQRVTSPAVMEWLMARYASSFDASVFSAPLWKSVDVGNWPATEYLLGVCGASPHLSADGNRTLLMLAAVKGLHGLHDLLCFHGADPHAVDVDGQSVLHYAVQGPGQRIVSDLVLQYRVDTSLRDKNGKTAVDIALQRGRADFVNILYSQPLQIDYLSRV